MEDQYLALREQHLSLKQRMNEQSLTIRQLKTQLQR
jgi:hypothetical protein